jgi:hypothetical protein
LLLLRSPRRRSGFASVLPHSGKALTELYPRRLWNELLTDAYTRYNLGAVVAAT